MRRLSECAYWEQLRLAGSALKQDVMARLPELLEQLERNVTARGGVVQWARDADDAESDRHRPDPGDRRR